MGTVLLSGFLTEEPSPCQIPNIAKETKKSEPDEEDQALAQQKESCLRNQAAAGQQPGSGSGPSTDKEHAESFSD